MAATSAVSGKITTKDIMSEFRISAKRILLTFNDVHHSPSTLLHILLSRLEKYNVTSYAAVGEPSRDGTLHVHVYLQTQKKLFSRKIEFFSITLDGFLYLPDCRRVKDLPSAHIPKGSAEYEAFFELETNEESVVDYILKNVLNSKDSLFQYEVSDNLRLRLSTNCALLSKEEAMLAFAKTGDLSNAFKLLNTLDPRKLASEYLSIKANILSVCQDSHVYYDVILPSYSYTDLTYGNLHASIAILVDSFLNRLSGILLLYPAYYHVRVAGIRTIVSYILGRFKFLERSAPSILICYDFDDLLSYSNQDLILISASSNWFELTFLEKLGCCSVGSKTICANTSCVTLSESCIILIFGKTPPSNEILEFYADTSYAYG